MTNIKKSHFVRFGPVIPIVPVTHFSKFNLPPDTFEKAWSIIGPSVEMNMRRDYAGRCLELWQVITAAYLEGLHHGSKLTEES